MIISVLSGKGGTGKTTISTNLSILMNYTYVDCDVEEPNGFLFLKPSIEKNIPVGVLNPLIDNEKCTLCKICATECQFNALAGLKNNIMLFDKLCHSCGTCSLVCKYDAIKEINREIGHIKKGNFKGNTVYEGRINVNEPMGIAIIKKLKELASKEDNVLLDSPPGTSCNVVETLQDVDYAVLVTEPSAFGLHDMDMAYNLTKKYNIKSGIIINRSNEDDYIIEDYAKKNNIKILGKIPFSKQAAKIYSNAELLIEDDYLKTHFENIKNNILKEIK
ncbi:MAG: ATP-binding protein [Peptostreptococcaceae bacterium]|jgi:MinD superfamily P-loop ATPase|nr:ATP-binding protein [Peptostreptococcaceae bacterium]